MKRVQPLSKATGASASPQPRSSFDAAKTQTRNETWATVDLSIRYAGPDDLPAVRRLIERSVRLSLSRDYCLDAVEALRAVAIPKSIPDKKLLVAQVDGYLAGCAGWAVPESPGERARIRSVYTDPAFAGLGIGSRLLALAEAGCFAAGHNRLFLKSSLSAVGFYRRNGWVPGRTERLFASDGRGFDVVAMTKNLFGAATAA